ncbi:MAG: DUF3299 domain-containing protein [Bacteroidia bacterium]|nr:DUF3299 domain-containing protein [Bacteroidia bacterium]
MDKIKGFMGIVVMVILPISLAAQQKISWETLAKVNYEYIQKVDQNLWFGKPSFPPEIKTLEGKTIRITGHVLPSDASENSYILSAFPFSSCFFCGGAGPESVVELRLKKKKEKYKLDQVVTFTGILRLNDREMELTYILEEAEAE